MFILLFMFYYCISIYCALIYFGETVEGTFIDFSCLHIAYVFNNLISCLRMVKCFSYFDTMLTYGLMLYFDTMLTYGLMLYFDTMLTYGLILNF